MHRINDHPNFLRTESFRYLSHIRPINDTLIQAQKRMSRKRT